MLLQRTRRRRDSRSALAGADGAAATSSVAPTDALAVRVYCARRRAAAERARTPAAVQALKRTDTMASMSSLDDSPPPSRRALRRPPASPIVPARGQRTAAAAPDGARRAPDTLVGDAAPERALAPPRPLHPGVGIVRAPPRTLVPLRIEHAATAAAPEHAYAVVTRALRRGHRRRHRRRAPALPGAAAARALYAAASMGHLAEAAGIGHLRARDE